MPKGVYKRKSSDEIKRLKENLICVECGKSYVLKTSRSLAYLKNRKFCSSDCYHKNPLSDVNKFKVGHSDLNKRGDKSPNWIGDNVGYWGIHSWVRRTLGRAVECSNCGTTDSKQYEWSSIEHKYLRDVSNWISLCSKCHRHYDKEFKLKQ